MPRVSVIIPSYNHEKYVAEAIQSVLDQTFEDFEIVITDDGSSDRTVDVIKGFNDKRIRLFTFEENRGAPFASRNCIANSRGEYLAMLSSDDIFFPGKLEKQAKFLDEHPEIYAVFGYARIIDEDGADFNDENHFYSSIFRQPNRTRHEWLRHFFFNSNCLCHPSVLARKEVYTELGWPDPRYPQLGDFYRWVKTCLRHEIHVMPEELIKFRVRAAEANVSGNRPEVLIRSHYEMSKIFRHYLEMDSPEDLLKVFPEATEYGEVEKDLIRYFIARVAIALATIHPLHELFGLDILFDLLGDKKTAEKLEKEYDFRYRDFVKLTGEHDVFNFEKAMRVEFAEKRLEDILNSASWKVTAPMRWTYGYLKK